MNRPTSGTTEFRYVIAANRATTVMSNTALCLLALAVLVMCIISFMDATDTRPKLGSKACIVAQNKFSDLNKSLARDYARAEEFTVRLTDLCK